MSRIEIDAGGRHIIIEHSGELDPLQKTALALWEATAGPEPSQGPAFGFQADRRGTYDIDPTGNGRGRRSADPISADADVWVTTAGIREADNA